MYMTHPTFGSQFWDKKVHFLLGWIRYVIAFSLRPIKIKTVGFLFKCIQPSYTNEKRCMNLLFEAILC